MLLRLLSFLAILLFPLAAVAQTPSLEGSTASLWDHNGSVVRMFRWPDGRIMIAYDKPRPRLEGLVPRGTVFFVATAKGNDVRGKAAVFKEGCKPAEYAVIGRFEGDGLGKLVVRGRLPIRRGCRVTGYAPPSQARELVLSRIGGVQDKPIARTDKTDGSPTVQAPVRVVEAGTGEYRGACIAKGVWEGSRADGGGGAAYRGCDQEEPPTYLSFQCQPGRSQLTVTSEVVFPRKPDDAVIPFTISVGSNRHVFRAKVDNSGMYESLSFELAFDHPVIEQLASGSEATISATGKPLTMHLGGSRQAIELMQRACSGSGESQVASGASKKLARLGLMPMADENTGMEIGVPADLPGKIDRATHGLNWKSVDGTLSVNLLRFPPERGLMTIFDALKTQAGRQITFESHSDTAFTLEGIDGGKSAFIVRVEQKGDEKRGLSIVYSLREGAPLAARARQMADTLKAFPSESVARPVSAEAAVEQGNWTAIAASTSHEPKRGIATAVHCHFDSGRRTGAASIAARLWTPDPAQVPRRAGEPTVINWEISRRPDPACRTPLYLVASFGPRVRFEGEGFLAVPVNALGPFDIKYDLEKTRVFFPLHLLDRTSGQFKVKSYAVGPLDVHWSLVEVPRLVDRPSRRNDFALGSEVTSKRMMLGGTPTYTAGPALLVVRDRFPVTAPKQVYLSNSGEFELQVFDRFYRVLDAKTGELVLERAGVDPNFWRCYT